MEEDNNTSSTPLESSSTTKFSSFREGKAEILCPCSKNQVKEVFYNPVQEFNRDLSSAVLKVYVDNLDQWKRKRCPWDAKDQKKIHEEEVISNEQMDGNKKAETVQDTRTSE